MQRTLLDDVRDFIHDKWKHSECELCGTDRWMVYPEPTEYAYLTVGSRSGPLIISAQATVAFLPLSCVNCGNLRLVDARVFEEWREVKELEQQCRLDSTAFRTNRRR